MPICYQFPKVCDSFCSYFCKYPAHNGIWDEETDNIIVTGLTQHQHHQYTVDWTNSKGRARYGRELNGRSIWSLHLYICMCQKFHYNKLRSVEITTTKLNSNFFELFSKDTLLAWKVYALSRLVSMNVSDFWFLLKLAACSNAIPMFVNVNCGK